MSSYEPIYQVTKHYPHTLGLSVCFRQWRALSHCRHLHGYALAFTFEFECSSLDARNWVIDFGSLKPLKLWLESTFDHKTIVAKDDPLLQFFVAMQHMDGISMITVDNVGCEAFAKMAADKAAEIIKDPSDAFPQRVRVSKVTCHEHDGNSASYHPPLPPPLPASASSRQNQD